MFRRFTALFSAFVFCLFLSSCHWFSPNRSTSDSAAFVPQQELLSHYEDRWCYSRLNRQQQRNYSAVYEAVYQSRFAVSTVNITSDGTETIRSGVAVDLPHPLSSEKEVSELYFAFVQDHPQFFFIGNLYGYDGTETFDRLRLTYTMDAQSRRIACDELEKTVQEFLSEMPDGDDFEKEVWMHDKLLGSCVYDQQAAEAEDPQLQYADSFTAYGALTKGKAVCEGYARSVLLLLQRMGFRATLVTGSDKQGNLHMWNLVTVNGRNYHLDATWNDTEWGIQHTYFNVSTAQIETTHSLDEENIWIDTCIATQDQYYIRKEYCITSYDLEEIVQVTLRQLRINSAVIELSFLQDVFANGCFFVENQEWFLETVNAAVQEGEPMMWKYRVVMYEQSFLLILLPNI